ncbi:hypothetical protein J4E93_007019 [Alternaria ventricosa]|uniref:uncharacterized protein n=1 Tax=Alternaria ventricosa TaxID=1187951 RepID=UPI0020C44676|nr:uncharacterized protein J4E93_007019 [Alternaria ventricosa]KAI4642950.1 hypothetical protein J4E93_007019 [Alternaria ventricosa]
MTVTVPLVLGVAAIYLVYSTIYNLWFHPLAKQPGPLFARISGIPSFYHACKGDRHIWSWRQFQIYGDKFRATPNLLLFQTPEAYNAMFGHKANVKKSPFYEVWRRNKHDLNTLGCTDVEVHARRRKALSLAFTEQSVKATVPFVARHVDRWNELLPGETFGGEGWSGPQNLTKWADYLLFDMFGDICFGSSNNTKEPGSNDLKSIPHNITRYLRFYNPLAKSPFRSLLLWLKPRGLDLLMKLITPKEIKAYFAFTEGLAKSRIETERKNEAEKRPVAREDMFHFLCTAKDPETGDYALSTDNLIADANLLTVAGSDTTSATVTALFFFITRNPKVYTKLVHEIRTNFNDVEEIGSAPDLMAKCEYLRAAVYESLRLSPAGPSELERTVLPGGIMIAGEHLSGGIIIGVPKWSLGRNEALWGDYNSFRPERWIVSDTNTQEEVNHLKRSFHPFSKGVGSCLGQKMAMIQLCMIVGRTLWRYDVRQAPGQNVGEGRPDLGWGQRNPGHFQLRDAYISLREGPIIQFKKRVL